MSAHLYQSALGNLPQGLRRVEPGGPWTVQQDQSASVVPSIRVPGRTQVRIVHDVADLLDQGQALEQFVDRLPPSPTLKDLQALREEEQDTDEPITHHAYDSAEKVLRFLDPVAGADLQPPHLAPDGSGGIRMEWFRGDTNVRVVIPAREDHRPYIYFIVAGISEMTRLTNAQLFSTLRLYIMPR
jgi:hypothetical protein